MGIAIGLKSRATLCDIDQRLKWTPHVGKEIKSNGLSFRRNSSCDVGCPATKGSERSIVNEVPFGIYVGRRTGGQGTSFQLTFIIEDDGTARGFAHRNDIAIL